MARVGLLHGVHRQRAHRVDAQLVKMAIVSRGVGGHGRCTHNLLFSLLRNSLKKFWKEPYTPAIETADSVSLRGGSLESLFDIYAGCRRRRRKAHATPGLEMSQAPKFIPEGCEREAN